MTFIDLSPFAKKRHVARRLRRVPAILLAAFTLLMASGLSGRAFACLVCDTNYTCLGGQEQGGYLCAAGQMSCGLIYKILGGECQAKYCSTSLVCDNRLRPTLMAQPLPPECDGGSDATNGASEPNDQ